jgi:hypothetical protein
MGNFLAVAGNFLRFANSAGELCREQVRYAARVGSLYGGSVDDAQEFDTFVQRMEDLISSETVEWRTSYTSGGPSSTDSSGTDEQP